MGRNGMAGWHVALAGCAPPARADLAYARKREGAPSWKAKSRAVWRAAEGKRRGQWHRESSGSGMGRKGEGRESDWMEVKRYERGGGERR